ncbi:MAG: hypothetical protein JO219_01950 [Candidatus Eremiobacteraeota bacterium]|nr:hypothetical protein [Candidatus Eremiobacteraeota bacterium]
MQVVIDFTARALSVLLAVVPSPTPQGGAPIATPPPTTAPATSAPASTPTAVPARTAPPTAAATLAPSPTPVPTAVRPAAVAIVWHMPAAPSSDQSVRAAAIALSAPDTLGAIERALHAHPRARFSLTIDASALAGLQSAAEGDSALQTLVAGHLVGGARADLMRVLAQVPVLDASLAMTPAARRYRSLAAAAPLALAGQRSATFTSSDYVEFAGLGALVRLAAAGELSSASDLSKNALTGEQAAAVLTQLAAADRKALDELKQLAQAGQLEIIADPANEPILPLLIDGGGKTGANIVMVNAAADAAMLSDQALHAATALQTNAAGLYSPHGAYDDATATMLEQHHAAFALFSDRVLRSSPIGGSRAAVIAADTAAFHSYAIHAAAGPALASLFWSQDDGAAISVLPPGLSANAMGDRVTELARAAGARGGEILVLRIEAEGLWNRRADRARVVDALAAALASDRAPSTTIAQFVHAHPPTISSYGFAPAADAGNLSYWMGTLNQARMWTALGDARQAAGGDAALQRETTRAALFEAEASRWYLTPDMIAPQSEVDRLMGQFRALIAHIYQDAGKQAPSGIAPLTPEPTPGARPHQ